MSNVLNASQGALWIQRTPGKAPEYVGCVDLDDIAAPQGDSTLSLCRDASGAFKTVGRSRGAPGAPTTSFTAWVYPEHSILDDIIASGCQLYLYAVTRLCGRADVFANYVRGRILTNAVLTNVSDSNIVKRTESGEQSVKLDVSADFPVSRVRALTVTRQDIAETTDLRDISFCNEAQCAGACGEQQDAGKDGVTVGEAPSGSPSSKADVWSTDDGGVTWANITGGAGHPFAAGEDIESVVCFQVDRSTTRWLVARADDPADNAEVAYSDDGGATWTVVAVGATNGEAANDHGALFALDKYHIWFATDIGNVYFSNDGGVSWTLQDAATASGGSALNAIHFADTEHGVAVGAAGTIIETTDGGETWAAVSDPSGGDAFSAVHVFNQYRWILGTTVGGVWQTWNEGADFTEQSGYSGYATTNVVQDIRFVNDVVGFMIVDTSAPVGMVYRTINGGYDWEKLNSTPTNAGLNALAVIDENLAYVCGNAQGGTSVVLKVSG